MRGGAGEPVRLVALGRADEALPLRQRALQISETALPPEHPDIATRLDNLAYTLVDLGRADEALPLQQRADNIRTRRNEGTTP